MAAWAAGENAARQTREAIARQAVETLNLQAQALNGALEKFLLLAPLLARQAEIRSFVSSPQPADEEEIGNVLRTIRNFSGAVDVILLDAAEAEIQAARDALNSSEPIEPAIAMARRGVLGRQSLTLPGGRRVYAFVSAIRVDGRLDGFVAVLVGFEDFEASWSLSSNPIYIRDENGRILLSNRAGWRQRILSEVPEARAADFIDLKRELPTLGWELHVLADSTPIARSARAPAALAFLLVLVAGALALFVLRRREAAIAGQRKDRALALRLERQIRDRTLALRNANESLRMEVAERKAAEDRLRETQASLVHSAKLATLGQMSAALSHEYNQPVAAIRTYAENAERFLLAGKTDRVRGNLDRIGQLTQRMAELSRALLGFSRKPGSGLERVAMASVLGDAVILLRPRLKGNGVELRVDPALSELEVWGGRVRLSQIFVNLVSNAADAIVSAQEAKATERQGQISIELATIDTCSVTIRVSDNGPGIPEAVRETLFDPFVTTKPTGEGLGIGLAIVSSIVGDCDGSIGLEKTGPEGTSFLLTLRLSRPMTFEGESSLFHEPEAKVREMAS
ncbi:sensor histidine kinase [Jiella marina]|uniref:sensor histidine kinase n=1 Tax=Jiella sp. LLJ827 TaxID=2917712 RepID=UPI0021010C4A|nr:ATP-binding protein [Jiella sp. LLJ827]MCQ0987568.1 ATP-binding protein [Jiella sp. LLJ827]